MIQRRWGFLEITQREERLEPECLSPDCWSLVFSKLIIWVLYVYTCSWWRKHIFPLNRKPYGSLLKTRKLSRFSKSLSHSSLPSWSIRIPEYLNRSGHRILTVYVPATACTWFPRNAGKESSCHFTGEEIKVQRGRSPRAHLTPSKGWSDSLTPGLSRVKQQLDSPSFGVLLWRDDASTMC